MRYWNFSFIVSELVQVRLDNSVAECVNLSMPNVRNLQPHTLFRLRPFVFDFLFHGSEVFLSSS